MRYTKFPALMVALLWLLGLAFPAPGFAEQMKILEPVSFQMINSSNVTISIQFGFNMENEPKMFRAWLNGKPVGGLFEFADPYVANALLSPKDGLKASDKGTRVNVFAAEVEGPDGSKHREMVTFTVDCSGNHPPVAAVSQNERVFAHEFVQLDGSESSDADGDPLAYQWSFVTIPKKSKVAFSDFASATPNFIPDVPGTYVVQLVVDDYKAASAPKTVTIEAEELKILVDRQVDDKIFEILGKHGTVTHSAALEDVRTHHVAILDAKGRTAGELRDSDLLKSVLREGKWGLVLNVAEDHKGAGLTPHVGIVSKGEARAFLFRHLYDGNTPVFRIFELPPIDALTADSDPEILQRYAGMLLKTLKESWEGYPRSVQAPGPDTPIPPDLINTRWDCSRTFHWTKNSSGRQSSTKGRIQTAVVTINYTFTLFLDNGNQPSGNKQFLLLQLDTNANPNDGTVFMASSGDMDKHNEYAWFHDYLTVDVRPAPLNAPLRWVWEANDPSSPNTLNTYSANASFNMGFNQAQGILGSFTCSFNHSWTVSDWGISCNSQDINMFWKARSTNPPEHSGSYFAYNDMYDWYYGCGKPKMPNEMSLYQNQFHAAVVWRTESDDPAVSAVADQMATIDSHVVINAVDNWCDKDLGTTCCSSWNRHTSKTAFAQDFNFDLDLGAVIPIEITNITFDPNPVTVGATPAKITGTVTLASPARMPILILLSSNSNNATFPVDRFTVAKGATTGSFEVEVNANNLEPGHTYNVGITGFYAQKYTRQLTIQAQ